MRKTISRQLKVSLNIDFFQNCVAKISQGTCTQANLFGDHFCNRYFSLLFGNKFLFLFMRIKVTQQCFFVNWSVTIVPREDKALPSIQVFFAELRRSFSPSRARQERTLFLSRVLVVVIATDNNEYFSSYNSIKEVKIPLLIGTFRFLHCKYRAQGIQNFRIQVSLSRPYQINVTKSMARNPESRTVSDFLIICSVYMG